LRCGFRCRSTSRAISRSTGLFHSGAGALLSNTTGGSNTANGAFALFSNTTGHSNTAAGFYALEYNTTGQQNTANGYTALYSNTIGVQNTAIGLGALFLNTTGSDNTATGSGSLSSNTTGGSNTATGDVALALNSTGQENTADGYEALYSNTTGNHNTALGIYAGLNVTTANNVICIGADGNNVSNTTWIGNIYGVTTQSGTTAPVIVSDTGQLGTIASSERFKKDISSMDKASESILALRPVSFHYKCDAKNTPQFGLIAEEVAKVGPDLVLPDKEGRPYSVRYDQVNAMLLNEFLKAHRRIEEQEVTIMQLKTELHATAARQQRQIEALTAGLQRVSAQLEVSKPVRQTVSKSQ
jgi:hypothetical protein